MKTTILTAAILSFCLLTNSEAQQISACTNSDFESNNFTNWIGRTGDCCPVNTNIPGIVSGRHTIVTGSGFDPNSNNLVPMVAPGGGLFSARLGNSQSGAESEQLSYTFTVTPNIALFIYRFAVILQDPGHAPAVQPRFSIRVFDQSNQPITCGAYDVVSGANIPGFISYGSLRIKPWTTVGIELTGYIGQQVTIEFTTADCGMGAHFGYAYMDCYCSPFNITSDICPGSNTVTLTAPEGFSSYLWSNGDTLPNTTIVNPVLGTTYTCMVTSVTGCQVTLQTQLTPTNLTAEFYSVMECQNETRFIDSSYVVTGSSIAQWKWDFGDGTVSADQNPVHVFPASGNYNVTLIVFNSNCSDTITKTIYVKPSPISNFSYVPQCLGDPVAFFDQSTFAGGMITNFKWDFGDGSPLEFLQNTNHIFSSIGPFQVELEIESDNGCRDVSTRQLIPVLDPSANFTYISQCDNTDVTFSSISTYSCGPISSYLWDFGDGSLPDTSQNPVHQFPSTGIYTVAITLTAMNGVSAHDTLTVIVPDNPVVNFSATPACNSEPALFSDMSTVANGNIIGYEWYFGDGTILDGNQTETHIYPADGNYDVMLKVTTDHQCIDSASGVVSIWELPVADFSAGILSGCEPLEVPLQSMSAVGSGWIAENDWLVGLFVRDSTLNPNPTLMAGIYDVSLIATTNKGCKDTLTKTDYVEVFPLPKPDFIHSPKPATVYNPEVSFYDITPNILSRSWNFSDGNTSGLLNPRHYFSGKGVYPVELFVISNEGCENSIIKPVEIIEIFTVFFPNAFTPNGDGINDYYSGIGSNIKEIELFIFNRWGEMVFKGSGKEPKWDGKGTTGEITEGVYTWRAKIKDEEGEAYEKVGSVALIK